MVGFIAQSNKCENTWTPIAFFVNKYYFKTPVRLARGLYFRHCKLSPKWTTTAGRDFTLTLYGNNY